MESLQLVSHLKTGLRIQVGQRLIHEEHGRLRGKRSRDRDTLLLAAGKLCRVAVHEHPDLSIRGDSADGFIDLLFCEFSLLGEDFSAGYDRIFVIQGLSFCFIGFSDPVQFLFSSSAFAFAAASGSAASWIPYP